GYVKVLDFGLARLVDRRGPTPLASFVGTPGYMAPEQIRGEAVDAPGDVFAVGIVLSELLAGKHPFAAGSVAETMRAIVSRPAPGPRGPTRAAAPCLDALVERMLARSGAPRRTIAEVAGELKERPEPGRSRRWPRLALAAGLLAAVGLLATRLAPPGGTTA